MSNTMFKNKKTKDNQPDYKGELELEDGTKLDIAAWIRKDKNGNNYFSLKTSKPFEKKKEENKPLIDNSDLDDNIPFN